ncbi:Fic family protein [Clostridium sp. CS001]|uniref:Fic family protein n=1 Tax=Clostridium sp. CS001 TaxID=2880648 RepID=UPI001CF481F5|nr:Fic family protein [Clostridium sp. CS001]MCB2290935.1 Fic family protein [Clostridium sp. CS001]
MSEKGYVPPYTITDKTVNLISDITEIITKITINDNMSNNPRLRRDNRIRTIHASLAIENNSLSLDQVTDIINGKRILGAPDEICEVKNAFEAYNKLLELDPYNVNHILLAHKVLMNELTTEAGTFRSGGVGIFAGKQLVHMAPPAKQVPHLIKELVDWAKGAEVHPLIQSCVFHYEFEFIHPFADGNGRMGRMWQTLLLYKWKSLFGWLPIETLIRERQEEYYKVLGECDYSSDSGKFVEFLLKTIYDALCEIVDTEQVYVQVTEQVEKLLATMDDKEYSTKEIMALMGLKHRPSFRENYLLPALELGYIEMTIPDKPNSSKQKYRCIKYVKR